MVYINSEQLIIDSILENPSLEEYLKKEKDNLIWIQQQKPKRNQLREYRGALQSTQYKIKLTERLIKQKNCKHDQGQTFTFENNKQINICKECRGKI